ncbi:hypothetical protein AADZ86_10640 [Colwelliaceae bacterium BS250]
MKIFSKTLLLLITGLFAQSAVQAQEWQFKFTPYIWAAANDGKSGAYGTLPNGMPFESVSDIDISFSDLAEELDFGTMFNFTASNGDWLLYSEVTVLNIFDAKPPQPGTSDISVEIGGEIVDVAAGHRILARDNFNLYGYVGARYFNLEVDVESNNLGTISTGDDFVDPFIGVHAKWQINNTFGLQGRLEVGGLDDQPSENTLVSVVLDHNLNENWSLKYFYRMMKVDYKDNGFIYEMEVTGPGIGATYIF